MKSFGDYKGTLPYASELFGIYQPLLGWKSRIIGSRYEQFRSSLYNELAARTLIPARAPVQVQSSDGHTDGMASRVGALSFTVTHLDVLDLDRASEPHVSTTIDSGIARMILSELGKDPPKNWTKVITRPHIEELLKKFEGILSSPTELQKHSDLSDYVAAFSNAYAQTDTQLLLRELYAKECKVGGYLLFLAQHTPSSLNALFFQSPQSALLAAAQVEDPLLNFGADSYDAILSPIGIVHLYREYFFEFNTFLGPPVGHVWLSPGGTVELIEISTRRTLTEKTVEQALETTIKSESDITTQDDIADAVKEENRDNTKFGYTSEASASWPVFSATATADLSLDNTTTTSRETTHKQMRQQSEKLSSEIKRNFKTTFTSRNEMEETSSKRYVIQNTTDKLVNYELRRKMRTVVVQVQDIGKSLCWHTFVDDPGRELGIAKLVHIGKPPDLADLVQPDAPPIPTAQAQVVSISIPFVGIDTDDTDNAYTDGTETEVGVLDSTEHILADFDQKVTFATPGFTLAAVDLDPQGSDAKLSARNLQTSEGSSAGSFTVHLDYVNWNGQNQIPTKVTLHWDPSQAARDALTAQYNARMDDYNNEKASRFREAFYAAARERIKLASAITPRPADDLRDEERTVVYRMLISQLMGVGTHQSKHVISELVRSIFDVEKMLYFVAPEWWAPRLHRSAQQLGEAPRTTPRATDGGASSTGVSRVKSSTAWANLEVQLAGVTSGGASGGDSAVRGTSITSENIVDWGGAKELNRDNYYITEDSMLAKLGASLGWLLQLDGDNMRNAFLNSPWVKAVIPIRLGKEREALNWLQQAHVEGADGLDATYVAAPEDPPELQGTTIRGALDVLIEKIQESDHNARTPIIGNPADPEDASNHFAGSLPTEAVFEHGFYPLKGGVHFDGDGTEQAIFSQWVEILPTDQIAAMQVEYDPKTLEVKDPPA
jgi:hypothetical protein